MSGTFVGELYDQFLVCRLCSEHYTRPKTLSCMHTFCEACLEMHYDMEEQDRSYRFLTYTRALPCPICRVKTELPAGGIHRLPDNFLVANLGEVIKRRKPTTGGVARCEICAGARSCVSRGRWEEEGGNDEDEGPPAATTKCLDCVKMLCASCAELHRRTRVTQTHTLFDADVQKDVECKVHDNETLRFYCEQCEACVCVLCTFQEHQDHDVSSLTDGVARHRGTFEKQLGDCSERIARMRTQLEQIERCELGMMRAEALVRDATIEAIAVVRRREKELMAGIRDTVGEHALKFIADKETLVENLRNTETTFQMTDVMLKGTSIELLMVKKEMQEKLSSVLDANLEQTPEGLEKSVEFCPDVCFRDVVNPANLKISAAYAKEIKNEPLETRKAWTMEAGMQTEAVEFKTVETERVRMTEAGAQTEAVEFKTAETETGVDVSPKHAMNQINGDVDIISNTGVKKLFTTSEFELITPVEYISPVEYVTPVSKEQSLDTTSTVHSDLTDSEPRRPDPSDIIPSQQTSEQFAAFAQQTSASKSNLAQNWQNSLNRRASLTKSFEFSPPSTPSGAVGAMKGLFGTSVDGGGIISVTTGARVPWTPPQPRPQVVLTSTGTSMDPVSFSDATTSMPKVLVFDKQCCTPYIIMTNKAVSTENQGMVDKSTSTIVDVTAAYRNMAASRRLVTVSRGTCTPRAMFPSLEGAMSFGAAASAVGSQGSQNGNLSNPCVPLTRSVDTSAQLRLIVPVQPSSG